MARRDQLQTLKAFVEIRSAQKLAASARVAEAQRALIRLEKRLQSERGLQDGRREAWAATVANPRLDLQLSLAWARALMDGEAAVDQAARSAQRADARRDAARADARAAEARHDAAEDLAGAAARRARRRVDEASIADAEDRFTQMRIAR